MGWAAAKLARYYCGKTGIDKELPFVDVENAWK